MKKNISSNLDMVEFGRSIGQSLSAGVLIELVGDVGAGKTTLTKGLALGLGVSDEVQSPSFTISRLYDARDGLRLCHYDFYRLHDAGLMATELFEAISDKKNIVVLEWASSVGLDLPVNRIVIDIKMKSENERLLDISASGSDVLALLEKIK